MRDKFLILITVLVGFSSFLAFNKYGNHRIKSKIPQKQITHEANDNDTYIKEMVGQMFFVSIPNVYLSQSLMDFLTNHHIGSVILFSNNIKHHLR